ncbi:MAG: hypothetical protein F2675_05285 [Actinobacteria bacterium]|nr:hypothetical protein [Actinomycetota bacterium]MSY41606.1 hypothetical protein [Actinomycetota bacterium]
MPVAPRLDTTKAIGRVSHHMWCRRSDFLVAPWAAIVFGRTRTGDGLHHPILTVIVFNTPRTRATWTAPLP